MTFKEPLTMSEREKAYKRCMGPWPRCGHLNNSCTACPEYQANITAKKAALPPTGGEGVADSLRTMLSLVLIKYGNSDEAINHEVEKAQAILAALQDSGQGEGGWQDISTAPKTDEANMVAVPFIGWCPEPEADGGGDQRICWWEPKTKGGQWWSDRDLPEHPTLWRVLPSGPLEGEK